MTVQDTYSLLRWPESEYCWLGRAGWERVAIWAAQDSAQAALARSGGNSAVVGLLASDPAVLALELQVANKRMVCSASNQASKLSHTLGCQTADFIVSWMFDVHVVKM